MLADPLESLDAVMGALNLVRFVLARSIRAKGEALAGPSAAMLSLTNQAVVQLQRESLEPLDKWLRMRMDRLWAEANLAEQNSKPGDESVLAMRTSFTHLHVATEVAARALELCPQHG